MAGLGNKVKLTILKGMEAVGQGASNLATNAQHKLQELNLETQRREILSDFPLRAYDLWQKGETFPEPLAEMLKELSELDERLGVMRAQRYARVEAAESGLADKTAEAPVDAPEQDKTAEAPEQDKTEDAPETCPKPEEPLDAEAAGDEQALREPMDEGETGDNA